ncbi:hypothetical protein BU23DRAFT_368103, partial [Bimuria novae-zelandiae CBS 107.79]
QLRQKEKELLNTKREVEGFRTRWKQTAKDLRKIQTQGQGPNQVTDNYLIGLVKRLRYNIQNFCIQYF